MFCKENRSDFVKEVSSFYVEVESATIRSTADNFAVSKTLVAVILNKELKGVDAILFRKVKEKINKNKKARAYRGGLAMKLKSKRKKEAKENGNS